MAAGTVTGGVVDIDHVGLSPTFTQPSVCELAPGLARATSCFVNWQRDKGAEA